MISIYCLLAFIALVSGLPLSQSNHEESRHTSDKPTSLLRRGDWCSINYDGPRMGCFPLPKFKKPPPSSRPPPAPKSKQKSGDPGRPTTLVQRLELPPISAAATGRDEYIESNNDGERRRLWSVNYSRRRKDNYDLVLRFVPEPSAVENGWRFQNARVYFAHNQYSTWMPGANGAITVQNSDYMDAIAEHDNYVVFTVEVTPPERDTGQGTSGHAADKPPP